MTQTGDAGTLVLAQRYRLDERIGSGSMGAVWRAADELLGRTVAVKQLLLQPGAPGFGGRGAQMEEARQRILREGRLAARLQHPHTIAVFDVVLHDDVPWLVMEYLPSRTLGALLEEQGPLDPREAAGIGRQVADGLAAAHAAGIVHRDIKPGNVLIGVDGTVKITDFGVSRAADDVQLTRTGLIAGTPAFLAPEVARGQTPTPASDVFALGSTLYAAVEGEPPFGLDENAYALLYAVGAGDVRPPGRAGPLTSALMRMLRAAPDERPDAAKARDELTAVAAGRVAAGRAAAARPSRTRSGVGRAGTRVDLTPTAPPEPARPEPAPPEPARPEPARPEPARPEPAPPRPTPPRPTPPAPRRRRSSVLTAGIALVVLVLVAVATIAILRAPGAGSTSAADGPFAAPAAPAAPAVPAPAPGRASQGQPSAAELEDFVRAYYALLPAQPDAAWRRLGEPARDASQGLTGYRGFYDGIARISFAEGPKAVDRETVRATLRFERADGATSTERYQFTVVPDTSGGLVMRAFSRD